MTSLPVYIWIPLPACNSSQFPVTFFFTWQAFIGVERQKSVQIMSVYLDECSQESTCNYHSDQEKVLDQPFKNHFLPLQPLPLILSTNYCHSDFWHTRLVWPVFNIYMNRIIISVFFCVQLLLVNVVCCGSSFMFIAILYSFVEYHDLFIHSPVYGQLYCMETTNSKCY